MWLMNGAHMIDRLTYILDSDVVAVKAFVGTRYNDIKADDAALAYLQLANGVPCTIAHTGFRDHPGAGRRAVRGRGGAVLHGGHAARRSTGASCSAPFPRRLPRTRAARASAGGRRAPSGRRCPWSGATPSPSSTSASWPASRATARSR